MCTAVYDRVHGDWADPGTSRSGGPGATQHYAGLDWRACVMMTRKAFLIHTERERLEGVMNQTGNFQMNM